LPKQSNIKTITIAIEVAFAITAIGN